MKLKIALFAALALIGCKSSSESIDGEGSKLSTISVTKFQPKADGKAWASMSLVVTNAADGQKAAEHSAKFSDFATGSSAIEMKLKFGSYKFALEYLDADSKPVYRACDTTPKAVNAPKVPLKIDICVVAPATGETGDKAGEIGDEASVTVEPVLKDPAGSAAGNTAGIGSTVGADSFLSVYKDGSVLCTSLTNAKFGDAAVKKSHLCAIHIKEVEAGFYLKGSIRVNATGKSARVTMSGFGLATAKNWSAREGAALDTKSELVPVELGKAACLAGAPVKDQIGTVLVYTDAGGNLEFKEFASVGFSKVSCK